LAKHIGQFKKGDPRIGTKPKGAQHHRTKFLAGLKSQGKSEEDFIQKIMELAQEGNTTCLNIAASRLWKETKQTLPAVELPPSESKQEAANIIIEAMLSGKLPSDQGASMMSVLRGGAELVEVAEILERLKALEAM
jgi:hypothetical protein